MQTHLPPAPVLRGCGAAGSPMHASAGRSTEPALGTRARPCASGDESRLSSSAARLAPTTPAGSQGAGLPNYKKINN